MELISYIDLKNHLLSISDAEKRALFCLIYAGMAREGEVVRPRYGNNKPLQAEDVKPFDNRIEITIHSEKSKRIKRIDKFGRLLEKPRSISVAPRLRVVPIYRNREAWLVDIIEDFCIEKNSGPLFDYSTRWAEYQFKKWFPDIVSNRGSDKSGSSHTIHWLRAWRYSHYRRGSITGAVVDSKLASMLGGWVSSAVPEKFYDFTRIEDFHSVLENVF